MQGEQQISHILLRHPFILKVAQDRETMAVLAGPSLVVNASTLHNASFKRAHRSDCAINRNMLIALGADWTDSTFHDLLQSLVIFIPPLLQLLQPPPRHACVSIPIHTINFSHICLIIYKPSLLLIPELSILHTIIDTLNISDDL